MPGDEVRVVVTQIEKDQCRLRLSLRQINADPLTQNIDTLMPLDNETTSDLQWETSGTPLTGLEDIVELLQQENKVEGVEFGRYAEAPSAVSQVGSMQVSNKDICTSINWSLLSKCCCPDVDF